MGITIHCKKMSDDLSRQDSFSKTGVAFAAPVFNTLILVGKASGGNCRWQILSVVLL